MSADPALELMRRAAALARGHRLEEASALLERAADLHRSAGRPAEEARCRQLAATLTRLACDPAVTAARAQALADLDLLDVAAALDRRDLTAAGSAAASARAHALTARSPLAYLGAALAIAEVADATGDRPAAYGSLASALVTLADLLGRDEARELVEPRLLELRGRWGPPAFAAARAAYEAARRTSS